MSTNKVRKVTSRGFLIPAFLLKIILFGLIFVGIQKINSEKHTRLAIDASHQNNFKITSMEIDKAYSWFYTMDPTATPLLWYKGLANFRLGKTDEALINFNDGLQFNPSHSHSYNSLGIIYAIKSDFSKAKDYFITSLEIRPYSTESIINLAKIYIQEEDYKSAYAILLRVDLKEESNNYKSIMVLVLSNKIDSLSATMHDTLFIKYIAKVKESKPTVFELYKKSVEEGHSFEEQFFDYIAESIILNEKALSDDRKNQLKTYLIEN